MAQMSKTKKPAGAFRTVRRMETPQRKLMPAASAETKNRKEIQRAPRANTGNYRGSRKGSV